MSKKFTIVITNNETNEVETINSKGYVLMNVENRPEDGLEMIFAIDNVTPNEVGRMVRRLASPENDKDIATALKK